MEITPNAGNFGHIDAGTVSDLYSPQLKSSLPSVKTTRQRLTAKRSTAAPAASGIVVPFEAVLPCPIARRLIVFTQKDCNNHAPGKQTPSFCRLYPLQPP